MTNIEKEKYFDSNSFKQLLNNITIEQKVQRHHKINNDRLVYSQLLEYVQFQLENFNTNQNTNQLDSQPTNIDRLIMQPLTHQIAQLASRQCTERAQILTMIFNFYQQSLIIMDNACKQKIKDTYSSQSDKIQAQKLQFQNIIKSLQCQLTALKNQNKQKWKTFYLIVNQNRVLRRQKGKLLRSIQDQTMKMISLAKQNEKNKLLLTYNNQHTSLDLFIKNSNSIMQLQEFMKCYPKYTKKNLKLSLEKLEIQENQTLNEKIQYLIKAARQEGIIDEYEDLVDVIKQNKFIVNMSTQTDSFDINTSSDTIIEQPPTTHNITTKSRHTQTIPLQLDIINNVVNEVIYKKIKLDKSKTANRRNAIQTSLIHDVALNNSISHFKDNMVIKKIVNVRITAKQSMSIRKGKLFSNIINLAIANGQWLLKSHQSLKRQSIYGSRKSLMKQYGHEDSSKRNLQYRNSKKQSILSISKDMQTSKRKQSMMRSIVKTESYVLNDKDQDQNILINIKSSHRIDEQQDKIRDSNIIQSILSKSNKTSIRNTSNFLKITQQANQQSNSALSLPKTESTTKIPLYGQTNSQIQETNKIQLQGIENIQASQPKRIHKQIKKVKNLAKGFKNSINTRFSIPCKNKTSKSKGRISLVIQDNLKNIISNKDQNLYKGRNSLLSPLKQVHHRPSNQITQVITQEPNEWSLNNLSQLEQTIKQNDRVVEHRSSDIIKSRPKKGQYLLSKKINTLPVEAQNQNTMSYLSMSKDQFSKYSQTCNDYKFKMSAQPLYNDKKCEQRSANKAENPSKFNKIKEKIKVINMLNSDGLKFCQKVYKSAFSRKKQLIEMKIGLQQFIRSYIKMNYGQHTVFVMNNHHMSLHKDKQNTNLIQLFSILLDHNQPLLYLQFLFKLFLKLITINHHHGLFIQKSRQSKIHKQFASIHFNQTKAQQTVTSFENTLINRSYLSICQIFINMEIKLHKQLKQCQLYTFLQHLLPKSQSSLAVNQLQQIYHLFIFQKQYSILNNHLQSCKKKEIDILSLCFYSIKHQITLLTKIIDYINNKFKQSKDNQWIQQQQARSMLKMTDKCNWSFGIISQYKFNYPLQTKILLNKYLKLIFKNTIQYKSSINNTHPIIQKQQLLTNYDNLFQF